MDTDGTGSGEAVRDLFARLHLAWNERNAQDFASLFTDHGTMIGFDGSQATGAEILSHLSEIFRDHPTGAYVSQVREVVPLGSGAAMLRAIVGMVPPGQSDLNPDVNAIQTLVAAERSGTWRIVLFQNTPAQYHGRPELVAQHTAELQTVAGAQSAPE